jgi:hypothetical protein
MGHAQRANPNVNIKTRSMQNLPGVIGVVSGDRTAYKEFAVCLALAQRPAGCDLIWLPSTAGGVAAGRNTVVRRALELHSAWVWFMDDDHTFAPTTLLRLLKRGVDMVQPLVLRRHPPYAPLLFRHFHVDSTLTDADLLRAFETGNGPMVLAPFQRGLVEVGTCGTGGLLVAIEVFKALPDPWFVFGKFGSETPAGEDTWFCLCARRAGFHVYVDLDTPIGHLTTAAVWPISANALGEVKMDVELEHDAASIRRRVGNHD